MKPELQEKLYREYPKIFKQKDLTIQQSCMPWGICTGDGWFNLIDKLCSFLQFHTDHNGYPQIEATQLKEKFGILRFYFVGYNLEEEEFKKKFPYKEKPESIEFLEGAIAFAESLSGRICEDCGNPGRPNDFGWITTLCDKCREEYEKRTKWEDKREKPDSDAKEET